jgi:hypothetical protein
MTESNKVLTEEEFREMLRSAFLSPLVASDMADDLGYSRSAVNRWINGISTPHPAMWPSVKKWIEEHYKAEGRTAT